MEVIVDDGHLRVSWLPGGAEVLFVVFTGISHGLGGMQIEEFVGTTSRGGMNSALFVSDCKRTWYNEPRVIGGTLAVLEEFRAKLAPRRIVSIGNSMGGFGAILLSKLVPVDSVISFVPQFSVHPTIVPEETRWQEYTARIGSYLYPDLSDAFLPGTAYYIFNGSEPHERIHSRRFPHAENVCNLEFPDAGHALAAALKRDGLLTTIVDLCVARDTGALCALLEARYGAVRLT